MVPNLLTLNTILHLTGPLLSPRRVTLAHRKITTEIRIRKPVIVTIVINGQVFCFYMQCTRLPVRDLPHFTRYDSNLLQKFCDKCISKI